MMLRRALVRQRPLHVIIRAAPTGSPLANRFNPIIFLASTDNTTTSNRDDPTNLPFQVRWKRNDGNSVFMEPRKTTRKQKKSYRKRQREIYHEQVGKHSAPNSKASIRRQFDEETRQDLLNRNKPDVNTGELEYDYNDALLDDLMGNTAELTSTSTPEPIYLGDKHRLYYNQVADQMARYKHAMESVDEEASTTTTALISMEGLPTDHEISMVVRSYRDRNGKRLKPVGVAKVLEHLLKDLQLPISTFGEESFTSILTCCSTPKEARRMFRLMQDLSHPISSYSWSILVDIHAKLGDFQGCDQVLREMVIAGVTPTLPAYTSLLAACHKVVNAGHIPHSVRAEAGKLGWSKWKEMRIIGVEPDAMAYGAMLRLCAARGRAEHSLNVLEEMQTFGVKPTTLCFSSALRAVARSHQIAIRFENGASPRYRKRQEVAAYHGKLTRQVVILAEAAEVEQDDGFIAALMLCAGASGDSATAKAILLASEIRKMDHLRTIGSDDHLKRLHGGNDSHDDDPLSIDAKLSQLFLNGDTSAAETMMEESMKEIGLTGGAMMSTEAKKAPAQITYGEREYGSDSRVLSALMQACSQAVDANGMGSLWEGRDNRGYLCENSLRMLTIKPEPKMMDNSIPGVSSTSVGLGSLTYDEEEPENMSKRLRRAKFQGISMDDSGTNMDDLDPYFYNMFKGDDPILNRVNPDSVEEVLPQDDPAWDLGSREVIAPEVQQASVQPKEEWYFDIDERKWKSRMTIQSTEEDTGDANANIDSNELFDTEFGLEQGEEEQDLLEGASHLYFDADEGRVYDSKYQTQSQTTSSELKEDWYFDQAESKWKVRLLDANNEVKMVQPALTEYEASSLSEEAQQSLISYPKSTDDYHDTGGMLVSSFVIVVSSNSRVLHVARGSVLSF
jgi:pentatricopeptide repeat protein